MILLGSIMLETFMVYPNIFYNPPDSFKAGLEFMKVRTPHEFYPPLGFFSWLLGAASLAAAWPVGRARRWILVSVAMIVAEGLSLARSSGRVTPSCLSKGRPCIRQPNFGR